MTTKIQEEEIILEKEDEESDGSFSELIEGEDFYYNDEGLFVFTESYHKKRGYCCKSGCLHCPYGFSLD